MTKHFRRDLDGLSTARDGDRPRIATRVGVFTAGAALAGAGMFGAPALTPAASSAATVVHHDVTLTADPTFVESLQSLLDVSGLGNFGEVLGWFPHVGADALTTGSTVADLLAGFNPDGLTVGTIFSWFGVPLTGVVYSSDPDVDSLLGASGIIDIGGEGIGDQSFNDLIDLFLGDGAHGESLQSFAESIGFGDLNLGAFTGLLIPFLPEGLTVDSDLGEWVGTLLAMFTGQENPIDSTTTLGDFLHTIEIPNPNYDPADSASGPETIALDGANVGQLLGFADDEDKTWDQFVSGLSLGDDENGDPIAIGGQTLGQMLDSFLPVDSTLEVGDDTDVTNYLDAFGVFDFLNG